MGPNRVGDFLPSPEDGNISSFQNAVFLLEFRTMDKVQNPSTSVLHAIVRIVYILLLLLLLLLTPVKAMRGILAILCPRSASGLFSGTSIQLGCDLSVRRSDSSRAKHSGALIVE
jgi:hypothetical protein